MHERVDHVSRIEFFLEEGGKITGCIRRVLSLIVLIRPAMLGFAQTADALAISDSSDVGRSGRGIA